MKKNHENRLVADKYKGDILVMEKNCIRICSDPYKKHIDYFWYEENGEWNNMEVNTENLISLPISHNAYDILSWIREDLYNPTVGMRIIFEGTDDDYEDFSSIKEQYFSDYDIELEEGSRKLKSAKDVMPQIENSYSILKDYFDEYRDPEIEATLSKFTDAVKPEIALCVMGLYSSGKSAFINSLVGKEILPSASDPATAKIYKIRESDEQYILFRFQDEDYKIEFEGAQWKSNKNPDSEIIKLISEKINKNSPKTEEQHMYWTLCALNEFAKGEGKSKHKELIACAEKYLDKSQIDNSRNDEEKIEKLLRNHRIKELLANRELSPNKLDDVIEVYISFNKSYMPLDKFKFVIYDTPGSNSVMFREHADILKDSLEQQTNGLPVFVTTPENMDSNDNVDIISIIDKLGGALDRSNMMLVVNKADQETQEELISKNENKDNLVVTKWRASRVYFVSSIIGLGGKKNNPEKKEGWIDQRSYKVFRDNRRSFEDSEDELYMRLFDYNILPVDAQERLSKRIEDINEEELLLWNSGVPCVEEDIGVFARKYALYNKCSQAIEYLSEAVHKIEESADIAAEDAQKIRKNIAERLDEKEKSLLKEIDDECEKKKSYYTNRFSSGEGITPIIEEYLNKKRVEGIVKAAKESSPGKNEYEKVRPFSNKIEEHLQKDMTSYSKKASKIILDFWSKCASDFRDSLMKKVVESDALSDAQKEILKEELMRVRSVSSAHRTLDIGNNSDAIVFKGKRFLWILWDMTAILEDECSKEYIKSLRNDISSSNREVINENLRLFSEWVDHLKNKIESILSDFNPEMSELSRKLKEQDLVIETKREQKKYICEQISVIESLIHFKEV